MEPVLKFVNVNKYYNNNVHALHNISLEIAAGEFISVIGPSGSGKSTLLRTVNRLIDVSDGEICLDGENITNIGGKKLRAVRRKVGMIFQNYNLVYRLSVLQNVLHGYLGYLDGIKGILGIYPEEEKLLKKPIRRWGRAWMKWMEAEYPADVDILVCECRWQIIPREIDIEAEERFDELDEIYRKDHPRPTEFNAIRKWEKERLMTLEHQVMEEIVYKLRE